MLIVEAPYGKSTQHPQAPYTALKALGFWEGQDLLVSKQNYRETQTNRHYRCRLLPLLVILRVNRLETGTSKAQAYLEAQSQQVHL